MAPGGKTQETIGSLLKSTASEISHFHASSHPASSNSSKLLSVPHGIWPQWLFKGKRWRLTLHLPFSLWISGWYLMPYQFSDKSKKSYWFPAFSGFKMGTA